MRGPVVHNKAVGCRLSPFTQVEIRANMTLGLLIVRLPLLLWDHRHRLSMTSVTRNVALLVATPRSNVRRSLPFSAFS